MRITIFTKLLMGFGAMLLLTCLVGGIGLRGLLGVSARTEETFRRNNELQRNLEEIKGSMLEARKSEKSFLLEGDEIFERKMEEQIESIKRGCRELLDLRLGFGEEEISDIVALADEYHRGFTWVAGRINKRGHGNQGLVGTFRENVNHLEEAIGMTGRKKLIIDWLTIRGHERDYLLYGEVESIKKLEEMIKAFNTHAMAAPLHVSARAEIKRYIDDYWALFTRIVILDAGIERLRGVYTEAARSIETIVDKLGAQGDEWTKRTVVETDRVFKRSARIIRAFLLLSIGLGAGISFFLSRGFSKPIRALAQAARHVARGDLTQSVPSGAKDEVGELSRDFNQMVEDLRRSHEEIEAESQALEQRVREMAMLHEIGLVTSSTLELSEVLDCIHRELERIIDASTFSIALLDEDHNELHFEICFRAGERLTRPPLKLSAHKGFFDHILAEQKSLLVDDLEKQTEKIPNEPVIFDRSLRSWLGLPLVARGKTIGMLLVQSRKPHAFDHRDEELLSTVATQAAIAIDNAMLYEEIRKLAQELERKVEERTEELVKANRDLQDFTYIVSHDMRSPLVNIQGFSKRLEDIFTRVIQTLKSITQEEGPGEEWDESLKQLIGDMEQRIPQSFGFIFKGVKRMHEMNEQLLQLSRLTTQSVPRTTIDLAPMIHEILETMRFQIEEKGIELVVGHMPRITCEEPRIKQVFSNLLSNAITYIGDANPAPMIEIGHHDEQAYHLFYVRDNGIGIAKGDHTRIFRIFSRVGQDPAPGHGMGLAFVERIVKNHDGQIWVESEEGKGSTFFFTMAKQLAEKRKGMSNL